MRTRSEIFSVGDLLVDRISGKRGIITQARELIIQVKWDGETKKKYHRVDGICSCIASEEVLWSPVKS